MSGLIKKKIKIKFKGECLSHPYLYYSFELLSLKLKIKFQIKMKSGVNLNISVFYTVFMTVYELLITKILARKLFGELVICPSAIGVGG